MSNEKALQKSIEEKSKKYISKTQKPGKAVFDLPEENELLTVEFSGSKSLSGDFEYFTC